MSEFTVVLVGVVALWLLVSLVFARKTPPAVERLIYDLFYFMELIFEPHFGVLHVLQK